MDRSNEVMPAAQAEPTKSERRWTSRVAAALITLAILLFLAAVLFQPTTSRKPSKEDAPAAQSRM